MIPSLESLERTVSRYQRQDLHVVEHRPARDLVAAHDIFRVDQLSRTYVAVPAGQAPASWVELTGEERDSLIYPPAPPPDSTMEPGHAGFTPRNIVVGDRGVTDD
jgi:hypothetical protein